MIRRTAIFSNPICRGKAPAYRFISSQSNKEAQRASAPEHRVQYNYDMFALHPKKEHYELPLVTANELASSKTRPRSVRMLTRDFIHDSLYNPHYGYFSRQAELLPSQKGASHKAHLEAAFPFQDIKNETDFMKEVQLRYMAFEERFQEACRERERRRHKNEPTLQERIEALAEAQKRTPWGSAERLDLARQMGRLQREQSNANVSDVEVDAMAAGQVWHTPTQLFSPHYGRALARYLVAEYKLHLFPYHDLILYELGGGTGTLAKDILDYIEAHEPDVYAHTRYRIVEISARLAEQQRARLKHHAQQGCVDVVHRDFLTWKEDVTEPCFVIALEVLDNLTHDVVRYSTDDLQPYQGLVSIDHTGDFIELWEPVQDPLIQRYLKLLSTVRPTVLPPGAPFYLGWIPRSWRHMLHKKVPFYPNLTEPHYIPTGALQMLDVLKTRFPFHRLVVSDFSSLPDALPGVQGPVVQTRHNGTMIPVTTYCVLQGFFDIFFPTDFQLLRDMYLYLMSQPEPENPTLDMPDDYFSSTYPDAFYADASASSDALYEDYSRPPRRSIVSSNIIPPPLIKDSRETRILSHAEFLTRYAEAKATELRDGSNPMISWYANASWLLT
ncbi:Similar to S.cerevisiae protein YKL162C (Putative protein of unknown function) [Malassezia sympodialis ATCC 42132]|uniref:type II protein arginine methyltransferase n=1 Tax=Malassezia sympodialis (strain ATCC 42132) TaxID=1230383 RepID=A0A1M8A062_MALS4|nr:Similar to S.cerevisiae protein YKL162C (Putative protein of unknown function) [Malassezia sympodialis ATCC 42132]